jgi:hypothetical protein
MHPTRTPLQREALREIVIARVAATYRDRRLRGRIITNRLLTC